MAYSNDKDYDDVVRAWDTNLISIQQIQNSKKIAIKYVDMTLPCKNKFSFDESFARKFLGLNSSSATFSCFKCYHMRNINIFKTELPRVTSFLTNETLANQVGGHVREPMVTGVNIEQDIGHCITHGLMAFGRVIVKWSYSAAINRQDCRYDVQSFYDVIIGNGKINLIDPPALGWSIKLPSC
jgi:hypothetical protein